VQNSVQVKVTLSLIINKKSESPSGNRKFGLLKTQESNVKAFNSSE